jgi:hypothetical protein
MDCIGGGGGFGNGVVIGVETLRVCLDDIDGDLSIDGAPATVCRIVIVVLIGGRIGAFDETGGWLTSGTG